MKKRRWCRRRDDAVLFILKVLLWPFFFLRLGIRVRTERMRRDRPYLVLCNHQTFWDPIFVSLIYNRLIHFMATDNLFTNGFISKLLTFFFGPIPKRKQGGDLQAVRAAMSIAKEGGCVGIFPEGSTTYDGLPTSIDLGVAQLARRMKADLALCRLEGGYGCDPRWGTGLRRGHLFCSQVRLIPTEELRGMTDDEVHAMIVDTLRDDPPPSEYTYRSRRKAEHIESAVYVCPKCGAVSTISSHGNSFSCSACGLTGTYNEDLSLSFSDPSVGINLMSEWMELQRQSIDRVTSRDTDYIFEDDGVRFTLSERNIGKRMILGIGVLRLDRDAVSFSMQDGSERTVEVSDIEIISPVEGRKLIITTRENTYFLIGPKGFNPYKYAQAVFWLNGEGLREVK